MINCRISGRRDITTNIGKTTKQGSSYSGYFLQYKHSIDAKYVSLVYKRKKQQKKLPNPNLLFLVIPEKKQLFNGALHRPETNFQLFYRVSNLSLVSIVAVKKLRWNSVLSPVKRYTHKMISNMLGLNVQVWKSMSFWRLQTWEGEWENLNIDSSGFDKIIYSYLHL